LRVNAEQRQIIVEVAYRTADRRNNRPGIDGRAHFKYSLASSGRNEQRWRDFAPQSAKFCVADDAYDLVACALMAEATDAPPKRVLILEKSPGKVLVDHRGFPRCVRRQSIILGRVHGAGQDRDAAGP